MATQPEHILEAQLIKQLTTIGYTQVQIPNEEALLVNLKRQLEKHNNVTFTPKEFQQVVNILSKGSVFEKAKTLRQKQHLVRENGDNLYFEFLNMQHWCRNQYQVTNQVAMEGKYKNRYDVTLLINGLPLVQIELKRRGLEMKEAFNQVNRYQRHSFGAGAALFQYIQIFVISNGVNTKYYANNRYQSFKQTFYWTDKENNRISNILNGFTTNFLEPCHISKMICKYIVLNQTEKILMVLRPYQYYAVESIIDKVINSTHNGYIWHTTGSGKTLTSFKASQIIMQMPQVDKVVFVVDRKDLDYQTTKEFNSFAKGSVDGTDNTRELVNQFADDTRLIVTTIQKLNTAIKNKNYLSRMEQMRDKRVVFIFDECHRSQFGETHNRIKNFFRNHQLFGFTGTPIFADNAIKNELGKRTTKELFGNCLHKYVITDAINDGNVLKFAVEYVGRYRRKESSTEIDIEVEGIDTRELMESPKRLEMIVDYIIAHHDRKTHSRDFTAIFCVSSTDMLVNYYDIFKCKKEAGEHNLRVATIFSYVANEEDADARGYISDEVSVVEDTPALYGMNMHKRDKLESYIGDYNKLFGSNFTTRDSQSFYNYYNDISQKVKERKIDILLVVNMFLTGFDSKHLNTMYVDKNLRYHGLIQAYSRTNRILNEQKSQGNIVVFRNLKEATDEAITLFSNKEAIDVIIMEPYEDYVAKFNEAVVRLLAIASTVDNVDELYGDEEKLEFITAFRSLMRLKNTMSTFTDFKWDDLSMNEQTFNDYRSKYLDIWQEVSKPGPEKVSVLNDVDFELELIHRDEINVSYILKLLAELKGAMPEEREAKHKEVVDLLTGEVNLRSKKELIEQFIAENLPLIEDTDDIPEEFEKYWTQEQEKAFNRFVEEENLVANKTEKLIENYLYAEREPLRDDLLNLIDGKQPSVLQRKTIGDRLLRKVVDFVETFVDGMVG